MVYDVSLVRVADGFEMRCASLNIRADVDSFQIGFDATLPCASIDDLMPAPAAVELEARINNIAFRLVVDSVSRDRTFAKTAVSISGRGWAAALTDPVSATSVWMNTEVRSAQQLAAATLPPGWSLDWRLEDWLVPAGAWSFSGTPAAAVARIAEAAGGYVVAGRATKTLTVLHRYPVAPWELGTATPALVLPAAVTTKEALSVQSKAEYDGVYVSGETTGKTMLVKRRGTAGSRQAAMVTDALMTDEIAIRQRGLRVLADTGLQIWPTLTLPVLPETGIVDVGTLIDFDDGAVTRRGFVRASSVSAVFPRARQTIEVETHA